MKPWGTPAAAGRGRSGGRQRRRQERSGLAVHGGHQFRRRDAGRGRESDDVDQPGIPLTTLDPADVRPVQTDRCGEILLAPAPPYAELANGYPEAALGVHAAMVDA